MTRQRIDKKFARTKKSVADSARADSGENSSQRLGMFNTAALRCMADGRFPDAHALLMQALQVQPSDALSLCNLGLLFACEGKSELAQEYYRKAQAFAPDLVEAHLNSAVLHHRCSQFEAAEAGYLRAQALRPFHPEISFFLGTLYRETGRNDDAARAYRRAIELRSDYPEAHHDLGVMRMNRG